jgi:maltooligosyltrehalose trehalohydrolase
MTGSGAEERATASVDSDAPRAASRVPRETPWRLEMGARPEGNWTRFRVWAPRAGRVVVRVVGGGEVAMTPAGDGLHEAAAQAPPGTDYAYLLDGGQPLPDPVSRWQPQGVHGPSRVVNPDGYTWRDADWRGIPLEKLVIYELHTGTFTPEGTFAAIEQNLDCLRELGVTAVELMPVAEFPGGRNWGYDGVHLYAPQSSYGGPEGLKHLVDACHGAGLAVVLDVVYNHLGPEGNYLGAYGPYFSGRYRTPWGDALNFDDADCDPVRRHFIENALYWLTEYHVDALRLDAVHGIFDFGARHLLEELSEAFHTQAARLGRQAWLIAESDLNDVRVIRPRERGGWNVDAQWMDDFHHAQHALLTGSRQGYFADFGRVAHFVKALEAGFVYDGAYSTYRRRRHGSSSADVPGQQFVVCTQNHDQIANGSQGRRLATLSSPGQQKVTAALLLCAPYLPMLFMARGRHEELAAFLDGREFADPRAPETFARCRLDWTLPAREPHAGLLRWHRALLELRRAHPSLGNCRKDLTRAHYDEQARWLVLERGDPDGSAALLFCNFAKAPQAVPGPAAGGAWTLAMWSGDPAFGEAAPAADLPAALEGAAAGKAGVPLGPWEAALYLRNEPA